MTTEKKDQKTKENQKDTKGKAQADGKWIEKAQSTDFLSRIHSERDQRDED